MTPGSDDSDDKVVMDPAELETTGQVRARGSAERRAEAEPEIALGKGTRDHPASVPVSGVTRDSEPTTRIPIVGARGAPTDPGALYGQDRGASRRTRDFEQRDPVEVLRMWPHSPGARLDQGRGGVGTPAQGFELRKPHSRNDPGAESPEVRSERDVCADTAPLAGPGASIRRRTDDKIAIAHLALDLYRELGQLEAAHGACPVQVDVCTNQACQARIDALRGALIEACLLIQRLVMMPAATGSVDDQLRALLDLIEGDRQRR